MPLPFTHIMFFFYTFGALVTYIAVSAKIHGYKSTYEENIHMFAIISVGGICSIMPDFDAVYNLFTIGRFTHGDLMPISHNLLASYFAFAFATIVGYIVYHNIDKAAHLGVFGTAAFISHLLLDDIVRPTGNFYLYPLYNEPIRMFASLGIARASGSIVAYMAAGVGTTFFILGIMVLTLFSLKRLGFRFEYREDEDKL